MKKLKLGFTLAEVATALAIVGIIAAMVMPLLTKNLQKQQAGPTLGRAVEQITLGNQNMLQYANQILAESGSQTDVLSALQVRDINNDPELAADVANVYIIDDIDTLISSIRAYWALEHDEISAEEVLEVKEFDGTIAADTYAAMISGDAKRYNFSKLPASIAIAESPVLPAEANLDALDRQLGYLVFVDTTGWVNGPNTFGKDIFAFRLINNGTLRPLTGLDNGLEFTESIVRAGFRIDYY